MPRLTINEDEEIGNDQLAVRSPTKVTDTSRSTMAVVNSTLAAILDDDNQWNAPPGVEEVHLKSLHLNVQYCKLI